jgi:hypothetical protein
VPSNVKGEGVLTQRKCGTCKYFEEGGIAASGWCRHPDRQDLEHMVLVRKTELACRDGWDHDLWEPKDSSGGGSSRNGRRPSKAPRVLTESHESAWGQYSSPTDGEDVLIAADSRIDARENERNQAPVSEPELSPRASNVEPEFNPRDAWSSAFRPTAPVEVVEEPVDQLQDETVSQRFGASAGGWQGQLRRLGEQEIAGANQIPTPPVFTARTEEHRASKPSHMNGSSSDVDDHDETPDRPRVQQSGETEQFEVDPRIAEIQHRGFGVQEVDQVDASEDEDEDTVDEADDEAQPNRALPMIGNAQPSCRNCRDFLPSKDGARGWCNNPFAFEKRQEVPGNTVACQSTFGSWWSPSDDWWMERADIAHHSAPTPLVDNLIRQIRTRTLEDEGSTEVRDRS